MMDQNLSTFEWQSNSPFSFFFHLKEKEDGQGCCPSKGGKFCPSKYWY